MIEAHELVKTYDDVRALDGLDLTVGKGSVCALLGPNGAGKTTAVRILTTLATPDAGHATVGGFDVVTQPQRVRALIGLAGQHAAVDDDLTGRENLVILGLMLHLGRRAARRRADELLARFDLAEAGNRLVRTWSGGMRRRLDLIAAFLVEPALLVLDEPTTGLDPRSRQEIWTSVADRAAAGTTVLLTTQYLEEADRLADHVVIVDGGRVVAEGSPDVLKDTLGARIDVVVEHPSDADAVAAVLGRWATARPDVAGTRVTAPLPAGAVTLPDVVRALDADGLVVADVRLRRPTLDEVFLDRTERAA
ncbi:ATP-binding cassette domain-containing protein [Cryptosporangium aurantiacum]|uniref:ABC-2 type transport system ATP-binding protein n=1 Tax=Cryptosporangium aurantiacum TaxID=134849 RepID=A0A1M7JUH3_9ACTN|nr:ATP-binding cassette domain-containing protein [Cryptosporangium aurantiacum]SHM56197.1 ABC-2 type transport system ATP-binding protein [Cryptosporangium aurantiacum]